MTIEDEPTTAYAATATRTHEVVAAAAPALSGATSAAAEAASSAAHVAAEATAAAADAVSRVLHFSQLPAWMQANPYIQHGYRRPTGAVRDCLRSLGYPHNELINTWSHLLPGLFFLALLGGMDYLELRAAAAEAGREIEWRDWGMVQFYCACTGLCLMFSAIFHGMNAHSHDMAQRTLKLDYLGIVLTISSTCITSTYFGMRNDPRLQGIYISFTVLCAATVFWKVLSHEADGPHSAAWRAAIFFALGASGFVAIAHAGLVGGMEGLEKFPLLHISMTVTCYLVGTYLYVKRIPEICSPGTFDLWGASHQIFHVLVATGQIVFLYGLKDVLLVYYR